ncbi:MAG: DoxX family protein [Verrucomicrobia bacterium]|nr:DoxX family protein [Verrucomicrobiota bacterium]
MSIIQSLVAFIGRALLSIIFIASAIHKIADWQGTLQYLVQALTDWLALSAGNAMIQNGVEWALSNASLLLTLAVVFELIGGLLVFLGLWTRLGALLLILFLIPATLVFHHFWQLQGADRQMQMINFMKNVSITGGLLFLLAVGKGRKCSSGHDKSE